MSSSPPDLPVTDRVRRAMKVARREQQAFRHPVTSAEHVLLGLLDDKRALSSFALREMKIDVPELENRARRELTKGAPEPIVGEVMLFGTAQRWVAELKQRSVGTEHLLLAIIDSTCPAGTWLAEAGVKEADARATIERLLTILPRGSGANPAPPV